jgi:predicted DNA-binding transcriptional regulator YafY
LFEKLPENRDVEIEWQQKVKEILKELGRKNLVFIKKDSKDKTIKGSDKREELNKQLDNAKKRYRNYIIGTTQEGMKKCHAVDGYSKGIMSGCYDDTVFRLDPSFLGVDESKDESLLVLSSDEYTHLGEYLKKQKKSLRKMDGIFKVKNSLEMKVEEAAAKYKILEIIKSGKCVRFSYKSPKENKESVVSIKPKYINYNADTGFMYIVDWAGYKYRFDRIWGLSFEKCFETFDDESKLDVKPILSQETIDVKVIIRKREDPVKGRYEGLINKIKEDVRRRNMDPDYNVEEHFSETDEAYIYEDQILANERGEFKSWVYSYGSSMVVVEPRDLRDEIVASYKARLDYY